MRNFARAFLAASLALGAGCGGDAGVETVTYSRDVQRLLVPCTDCHRPGAPAGPNTGNGMNIEDPFAAEDGLLVADNLWKAGHMEIDSPIKLVVPGDPEESFLIDKISDPAEGRLPGDMAGAPMPYPLPPLSEAELASLELWIAEGAQDTPQFRGEVVPIIGTDGRYDRRNEVKSGKCLLCHFAASPIAPDLADPFGPNGLVNVRANYRADMLRVVPGEPDASFLLLKVRAQVPSSEQGAPMPRTYPPLTAAEVNTVRQWILDGALP